MLTRHARTKKLMTPEEAVQFVNNGDVITVSGVLGLCLPEKLLSALELRFITTGEPNELTWFDTQYACAGVGYEHLAHEGMLRKVIGVTYYFSPEMRQLFQENKVQAYCMPLGMTHLLLRAIIIKDMGIFTKVGLHTSYDPRLTGGKLNELAKEDIVELVRFGEEEWLFYKAFPINVAIIRGSTADEDGNISIEDEPLTLAMRQQALAAKAWGGRVIAQVKRIVQSGSIPPRQVEVPGILVDAVIVDQNQAQNESFPERYVFGVDGQYRAKHPPIPLLPLDADKIISRRAILNWQPGQRINVGGGVPMYSTTLVALEEGIQDLVYMVVEHGAWGGINYGSTLHINPVCLVNYDATISLYLGGLLDSCYFGFAEVDKDGNVNLDRYGDHPGGSGGALTIEHATQKVYILGTLTGGGLTIESGDGTLRIVREGHTKRFVDKVQWISFSSRAMNGKGKEVMFITERAVFKLVPGGLELVEIAPGINLERDVIGQMGFRPLISSKLREMDRRIFLQGRMGVRKDLIGENFDTDGLTIREFGSGEVFSSLSILSELQFIP